MTTDDGAPRSSILKQAIDAAKLIRETLKWLAAAFAALAAALLAGLQLSRIGTLRGRWLFAAITAVLISLGSVIWALSAVLGVLLPIDADLDDVGPYGEKLNKLLRDLLGEPSASVITVRDDFNTNTKCREDNDKKLARDIGRYGTRPVAAR